MGQSESFVRAIKNIPPLAQSDATVLICGETGTGKELFARAIHYHSPRRNKPFIPVNCAALPDHLFENELFGHVKGAFTDARSAEKGLIAEAEGGTLILDEVDTLSSAAQAKLLRFLQNGEYRPLGSSRSVTARCSDHRGDQRGSLRSGQSETVSRRSLLPSQCSITDHPAASRENGRYRPSVQSFLDAICERSVIPSDGVSPVRPYAS